MHVHIDFARIDGDEQRHHRLTAARQIIGVSAVDRADQHLVAHRPAVDEQILAERIGARVGRQRGKADHAEAFLAGHHLDRIGAEIGAENIAEPRQRSGKSGQRRRPGAGAALLAGQREGDIGPAHRQPPHHLAHGIAFGALALHEFQARRRRIEQVAHFDAGAGIQRGGSGLRFHTGIDAERPGMRLAGMARDDRQLRNRTDRWQGLAAEAQRRDRHQIVIVGQLRGGVPLDRKRQVVAGHADAVVGDADQPPAAAVGDDLDLLRAGIEGILDQFLHDAGGPFHHLAGGNAVDGGFG